MTRHFATVLLACAALASVAVAGVRIAGANGRHISDFDRHVRHYGTTPALAAATLASLRTPPGFRATKCYGAATPEWNCWSTSPSIVLDSTSIRRLIVAMGARPYSVYEATYHDDMPAVQCMRPHVIRKHHIGFQNCHGEALKGRERLLFFVKSFVTPSGQPTRRIIAEPTWKYPTEVEVAVEGHFEHEGPLPGEEEG